MAGIQIGGLVSGFDVESIIEELTKNDSKPLELMQAKKDRLEAAQSAWQDVNMRLTNLQNTVTQLKLSATFNSKTATSSDEKVLIASASTSAAAGSYQIKVNKLAAYHRYASGSAATITGNTDATSTTALGLTGSFTVKSADSTTTGSITVTSTDTLNSIRDKINAANAGVTASIVDNKLVIKSNTMGAAGQITLTDTGGTETAFTDLGLTETTAAQDAEIVYEGITITRGANSISDVISGVTLNLVSESTANVSLTIATDTAKASEAITAFVEQYNSLMDFIDEKTYVDPLATLTERDEDDISPYDENRERGELQGDATIIGLESQIRQMVSRSVAGLSPLLNSLSAIGITTSYSGAGERQSALLTIDESKLTAALAAEPGSASVTGHNSMPVKYNSFITKTAAGITGSSSATSSTDLNLTGSFTVKSADSAVTASITVLATDSLADIMNNINAAGAGVTASIVDNKLLLASNSMGTPGQIELTDTGGGTAFTDLGLTEQTRVSGADNAIQSGQSGRLIIEIDGKDYNIQFSGPKTSQQVIDDINAVIGEVAAASINSSNRLVITNRSNGTNSVIRIKQIIEDHSGGLAKLGLTQGESSRGKDVAALFTAQTAATQGTITSLSALGDTPVTGSGTLGLIIDGTEYTVSFTGAYNRGDIVSKINNAIGSAGQAYLDSNNCLVIRSLRAGTSSNIQVTRVDAGLAGLNLSVGQYGSGMNGVTGLAVTFYNFYNSWISSGGILSDKQDYLTGEIDDLEAQMSALTERIQSKADRLWEQFSNMETKLQELQYQSQWLSIQLAAITGNSSSSGSSS